MKKFTKMNKGIVLSALAALAFGGVAVGTTFALFTSKAETNVTVTTGKVNVVATATDLKTYSGKDLVGDDMDVLEETEVNGTFANGGTAVLDGTSITLSNVTPGDKVTFKLTVVNYSTVASKYRTKISASEDTGLFSGLKFNIGGSTVQTLGDWENLAAAPEEGETIGEYECSIELPSSADSAYGEKSCKIDFGVEAIQANAATHKKVEVSDESELRTALYNAPTAGMGVNIVLQDDISLNMVYSYELYNHSADAGIANMNDYEAGDTLSHYKVATSDWDEVNAEDNDKSAFGAKYKCDDARVGRLVVKANQDVIIDLNGHTLKKMDEADYGDWSNVYTDIIANYGKLKVTDSSENAGTVYGNGYNNCGGAVIHNYAGASLTIEKVNVDGNAASKSDGTDGKKGTGQSCIINQGGAVVIDGADVFDNLDTVNASLVKNADGQLTIKGGTSLKSTKVLNCEGGDINVLSGTLTSTSSSAYAIKAEGKAVVTITDSDVTISGNEKTADSGTIIHK